MSRIALVAHDAGGAELITSWAIHAENRGNEFLSSAMGPAIEIFSHNLKGFRNLNLPEAISNADWVLTATSWQSDHEKIALELAFHLGKHTAVFLDHWNYYEERLIFNGRQLLPKEIWVADEYAFRISSRLFLESKILLKSNMYLARVKQEIKRAEKDLYQEQGNLLNHKGLRILYVAENIDEHALRAFGDASHWGYNEKDAFMCFLHNIKNIQDNIASISIRQHPSHSCHAYNWTKKESQLITSTYSTQSLVDDIVSSDIVVGVESMAMVIALIAGRKVYSCKPPGVEKCILPHAEIEHISDIVQNQL